MTDEMGKAQDLAQRIARWTGGSNRLDTAIEGLGLHRWETPTEPTSYMLPPSVCLIGQGRKRLVLGEESYVYDAHRFLITSVDLPVVAQITEASEAEPYLGLTLELDLRLIAQLMLGQGAPSARSAEPHSGIAVSEVSEPLLDATNRLIDLLAQPEDIPVLAPLIKQEIFYRLLVGEQGARLRQIAMVGHHGYRISRAIDWLKGHYSEAVKVEELAGKAGLSLSAFHSHFRAMTAMSPLQYQKRMRLYEARRLMLTEHVDASRAAFEVGYESPSQFSREYRRQFGAPPMRDIRTLLQDAPG
ncbi:MULTISPECIES: AraC family transcriptional regulator [unclassified Guyparkeria]|uniref:AraC family transcriptional regulator n=1 Tax=unclassified Guyparkeria TaxID=2626246 RepID=UPI0007337AA1|nr:MULTISPECIES: AraC family transcriptional regulator [unclassified Guyparkeria]KTG17229.1 AraC family transcriptional regulator [Guyparkeria sp. XI15]OAE87199.1 AraC family transcriptional regulator [Guyparkeria sp. WRN-7]